MLGGYLSNKFQVLPKQTSKILNLFIIYISLPSMILLYVPKIKLSMDILIPFFISWAVTILGFITIYLLSKKFRWDDKTTGALMLIAVLGNTSFLGIPIVSHYYGTEALPYVMIYDQLGSFLALSTYGTFIVAFYSSSNKKIYIKDILKKIVLFPPFISLVFAFCLLNIEFNTSIYNILTLFANLLVPVALVSVGFTLQLKIPKKDIVPFGISLGVKLILIPVYSIVIIGIFNLEGLIAQVSILESAMGPMITAGILASISGMNEKLVSSIIGYGVILSFFTTAMIVQIINLLNI
jgi:predicted permease